MLTKNDEEWLRDAHPGLVRSNSGVAGPVEFTATYNRVTNRFLILGDGVADHVGGVSLSVAFRIRIEERTNKSISRLPAVYVDGVDAIEERHFCQADKSACLCSPLEEDEFLRPELQFRSFLEQLVIPFLYGQAFYSAHGHWPWVEYGHGAVGLLESYSLIQNEGRAEECLRQLAQDGRTWPKIRAALEQKTIKGHTPCFCPAAAHIRRCHPRAWQGIVQLRHDIRKSAIRLP
ncbi:MAG TPA: hypothetical protein VI685_22405 [Candidatus Angelobacter sp.]